MYKINEWQERYEVSIKGREPKSGEELRAGPLVYIRLKVYGHKQGMGYRRLQVVAGSRLMEVFGIFCKLLEISGNQPRDKRGGLLNEKDLPATVEDLAFIAGCSNKQMKNGLENLCKVGWIINTTKHNSTEHNTTQAIRYLPENPEKSGKPYLRAYSEDFLTFWKIYPKGAAKGDAFDRWAKIKPNKQLQVIILEAVQKQKLSPGWVKEKGKYIPNAATWLNRGSWEDDLDKAPEDPSKAIDTDAQDQRRRMLKTRGGVR